MAEWIQVSMWTCACLDDDMRPGQVRRHHSYALRCGDCGETQPGSKLAEGIEKRQKIAALETMAAGATVRPKPWSNDDMEPSDPTHDTKEGNP